MTIRLHPLSGSCMSVPVSLPAFLRVRSVDDGADQAVPRTSHERIHGCGAPRDRIPWCASCPSCFDNTNVRILTGIEVTTGPLGQGISNAVGMAIASKQLAATYNREDLKVVDNKIWCFTGDGCLQEGVGQEGTCARCSSRILHKLMINCSCLDCGPSWAG